jgi:hypothetical protein
MNTGERVKEIDSHCSQLRLRNDEEGNVGGAWGIIWWSKKWVQPATAELGPKFLKAKGSSLIDKIVGKIP